MADRRLIVEIIGDPTGFQAGLAKASASAVGFGDRWEATSKRLAATGAAMSKFITLPVAAIGAVSTKAAVDFQASMEMIHTQANVSQQAVAGLSKAVLGMAGSVATTPEVLSQGLFHLASQGLRGKQAIDALRIAAEGAKVGQANLEDVTNALGAAIVSGIRGSQNYTEAMGQLNAIVGAGDMHMQDLADAMGTGLPAKAAVAGVALKDVGAALAVFGDNNIRGAEAGTLLNSALRLMEGPSKAAQKAMAGVGLSANQLGQDLRSGGIVQAITDLKDHLQNLPKAEQFADLTHMFGGRQAGGVMILIDQLERLKTKEKEVADGGKSFASDWAAYTQTTAYKMDQLGASMSAAGISIGNILLPVVSQVVNKLSGFAQAFSALPGPVKDLILVLAGVAAVAGPVIGAIGSIGTALAFLAANPIVLVVAGVAALVAALAAAVLWPDKLKAALEGLGLSASTSAKVVGDLQAAFGMLKAAGEALVTAVRAHWAEIKTVIQAAVEVVATIVRDGAAVVEAVWKKWGDNMVAVLKAAWTLIRGVISGDLEVIRGILNVALGLLHGDWSRVWQGIKEIVGGTLEGIKAVIKGALDGFIALAAAFGKLILVPFQAAFNGIRAVIVGAFDDGLTAVRAFVKVVSAIPGEIKALFKDAGSWLYGAGQALIQGLISGLESELDHLKNVAGDVAHKLVSWKGPVDKDRVLLVPAGQALMQGLITGMQSQLPDLQRVASAVAPMMSTTMGATAAPALSSPTAAAGAATSLAGQTGQPQVHVTVNGWVGSDQQIAQRVAQELARMGRRGHNFSLGTLSQVTSR